MTRAGVGKCMQGGSGRRWTAGVLAAGTAAGATAVVWAGLLIGGAGAAHADALCDQLRAQYGPGWPCVSVPPPQTVTPPSVGDAPGAPQIGGSGPQAGAGGLNPGPGNGTPIVPVPGGDGGNGGGAGAQLPGEPNNPGQPGLTTAPAQVPTVPPATDTTSAVQAPPGTPSGDPKSNTPDTVTQQRVEQVEQFTPADSTDGDDSGIPLAAWVVGGAAALTAAHPRAGQAARRTIGGFRHTAPATVTPVGSDVATYQYPSVGPVSLVNGILPRGGSERATLGNTELVLINDASSSRTYVFDMHVPPGGHTAVNPDGTATVYDAEGNAVRKVQAPWAYDSLGRPQNTWYTVDENGDLVQHVDVQDDALYPILADPTYGSADAAEHWTAAEAPPPPAPESTPMNMTYGSADAGEHWTAPDPAPVESAPVNMTYGSADAAEAQTNDVSPSGESLAPSTPGQQYGSPDAAERALDPAVSAATATPSESGPVSADGAEHRQNPSYFRFLRLTEQPEGTTAVPVTDSAGNLVGTSYVDANGRQVSYVESQGNGVYYVVDQYGNEHQISETYDVEREVDPRGYEVTTARSGYVTNQSIARRDGSVTTTEIAPDGTATVIRTENLNGTVITEVPGDGGDTTRWIQYPDGRVVRTTTTNTSHGTETRILTTLPDGSRIEDYTSKFDGHVTSGQNLWGSDGTYNGGYAKTDGREVHIPEGNPYFETGLALIPIPGGPVVKALSKVPGVKQGVTKLGEQVERIPGVSKIIPKHTPGAVPDPAAAIPKPLPSHIANVQNVTSGTKGGWSKVLNNPAPNTRFVVDGGKFIYDTDHLGRVVRAEGILDNIGPAARNSYQQGIAGRADRLPGDDGGHLIASMFEGPGEAINLTAMRQTLNRTGSRDFYQLEQVWRGIVERGGTVNPTIKVIYQGESLRPTEYVVIWIDDAGNAMRNEFIN